ncbi:MAG: hypothetical protein JSW62_03430 [Thermoplasmatales archaeon]|nr:MAG: hypothetical protein JSW62_03430 [Thermoplasmatales archaeon]
MIKEKTKRVVIAIELAILVILSGFVVSLLLSGSDSDFSSPLKSLLTSADDTKDELRNSNYKETGLEDFRENHVPLVNAYASTKGGMPPLTVKFSFYIYGYYDSYDYYDNYYYNYGYYSSWFMHHSWHITGPDGFSDHTSEYSPKYTFETPGRYTARLTVYSTGSFQTATSYAYVDVYDPSKSVRVEKVSNFPFIFKKKSFDLQIVNQYSEELNDLKYTITIEGGLFNRIDEKKTGSLSQLSGNGSEIVQTPKLSFGLGRADLTVEVGNSEEEKVVKEYTLFLLGRRFIVI